MKQNFFDLLKYHSEKPKNSSRDWYGRANESLDFIKDNLENSEEIMLYAVGKSLYLECVLIPRETADHFNVDEPQNIDIRQDDTWSIERIHDSLNGHQIKLSPPLANSWTEQLKAGEKLVFVRFFNNYHQDEYPIELSQKLVHSLDLYFLPDRSAFCRLTEQGNLEKVIKIYETKVDTGNSIHAVTILAKYLFKYMAVTNTSLFCRFDATRVNGYDPITSKDGQHKKIHQNHLYFNSFVIDQHSSYINGYLIQHSEKTNDDLIVDWTNEFNKERQYASFIIYDRKNKKIVECSCNPKYTVNYFTQSELPWDISPVFFNPSVLYKYKSDSEKYTLTDR